VVGGTPANRMLPVVLPAVLRPASTSSRVVLPLPEGPICICVTNCYQGASPSNRLATSLVADQHIQQSDRALPRRLIGKELTAYARVSPIHKVWHRDLRDGTEWSLTLKHAQLDGSQDILR